LGNVTWDCNRHVGAGGLHTADIAPPAVVSEKDVLALDRRCRRLRFGCCDGIDATLLHHRHFVPSHLDHLDDEASFRRCRNGPINNFHWVRRLACDILRKETQLASPWPRNYTPRRSKKSRTILECTTIQISGLAQPEAMVEIEIIAVVE
jgi:hypothetical protein